MRNDRKPAARPDRRSLRSRRALIAAAEQLFAARGVEAVSVDDLIVAADLAKGTFYKHFEDKLALARAVVAGVNADVEASITDGSIGIDDLGLRCALALCTYARFASANPVRARALLRIEMAQWRHERHFERDLGKNIKAGLASGLYRAPDERSAMLFVLGVCNALLIASLGGRDPAVAATGLVTMGLVGLGLPAAKAADLAERAGGAVFKPELPSGFAASV